MTSVSQENESQTQDSAYSCNEDIDAEVTIPAAIARAGGPYTAIIDGQNYMIAIPAGVRKDQVVQVKAQASGKPQRILTVRILLQEAAPLNEPNTPANTKKVPWGTSIALIVGGFIMLFLLPPVGIGLMAFGISFIFIGKK